MKIKDSGFKILRKINVIDFIALIILVLLLLLSIKEIFNVIGKKNVDFSSENGEINIEFEVVMLSEKNFFDVIKIGDKLIERNNELLANVITIEILPVPVKPFYAQISDALIEVPSYEKAIVKISATIKNKNNTYKLGQQTIAIGKFFTFESKLYKYNAQIVNVVGIDK